jgi:hypothetical protein
VTAPHHVGRLQVHLALAGGVVGQAQAVAAQVAFESSKL